MRLHILFHDNCFDGAASAALFGRYYLARERPGAELTYQGMQHGLGEVFPPGTFAGDENACLDFRYSSSPRLTWWFDHHQSGFPTPADRAHFEAERSPRKHYDPTAPSCTGFLARVLEARFGWSDESFAEVVRWAEIIDAARFPDAAMAVNLVEPALRIMTFLESNHDPLRRRWLIDAFGRRDLAAIAADPTVAEPLAPVLARHEVAKREIAARTVLVGGVAFFDLLETAVETPNKFIVYRLHPGCAYAVGLTRSAARVKVSVGTNPWSPTPRRHDISKICERHGGGGHPVVGAISLPAGDLARGRRVAAEVVAELNS